MVVQIEAAAVQAGHRHPRAFARVALPLGLVELGVFAAWGPELACVLAGTVAGWWLAAGRRGIPAAVARRLVGPIAASLTFVAGALLALNELDRHASPHAAAALEDTLARVRFGFEHWTGSDVWPTLLIGTVLLLAQAALPQIPIRRMQRRAQTKLSWAHLTLIFLTSIAVYGQPLLQQAVSRRHANLQTEFRAALTEQQHLHNAWRAANWVTHHPPPPAQRQALAKSYLELRESGVEPAEVVTEAADGLTPGEVDAEVGPVPASEAELAAERLRVKRAEEGASSLRQGFAELLREATTSMLGSAVGGSEVAQAVAEQTLEVAGERGALTALPRLDNAAWLRDYARRLGHARPRTPLVRPGGARARGLHDVLHDLADVAELAEHIR